MQLGAVVSAVSLTEHLPIAAADEAIGLPSFMLEVSSPGLSSELTSELDFTAFRGFEVDVKTSEPHKGKQHFSGEWQLRARTCHRLKH